MVQCGYKESKKTEKAQFLFVVKLLAGITEGEKL